jgi:hypothetical protein
MAAFDVPGRWARRRGPDETGGAIRHDGEQPKLEYILAATILGGGMFKGTIPAGVPVTAELSLSRSARGPAFLSIAWSAGGTTGEQDSATVAPGGFGKVSVTPTEPAFLRVYVDMTSEGDTGRLEVSPATPTETIQGDTTWTYSVE